VTCALDTLVLGTANLARGKLWLEKFLSLTMGAQFAQPDMRCHARSVSVGDISLMLVAPDDTASNNANLPRWFGLDTADVLERIAARPRLVGWLARTNSEDDFDAIVARTGGMLGNMLDATFDDGIHRITNPADGFPIEGGLIPQLISRARVATTTDNQCRFTWMEAAHPHPAKVQYLLDEIGFTGKLVLTGSPPYAGMTMCAYIETPEGTRTLMS
jgi:Glyoxalase-like domain